MSLSEPINIINLRLNCSFHRILNTSPSNYITVFLVLAILKVTSINWMKPNDSYGPHPVLDVTNNRLRRNVGDKEEWVTIKRVKPYLGEEVKDVVSLPLIFEDWRRPARHGNRFDGMRVEDPNAYRSIPRGYIKEVQDFAKAFWHNLWTARPHLSGEDRNVFMLQKWFIFLPKQTLSILRVLLDLKLEDTINKAEQLMLDD
ncbi:hypothetical protein RF11_11296 [Thelohanellus kitauei]|uniref:Uncharacterized protein n=1 Tax=Thelohanellus kitauei TaxID=669202 RepID=A0A0C2MHR0_THEKT|nr:hypothetical protein RF11_11296 [Thelohanellus kitauei]